MSPGADRGGLIRSPNPINLQGNNVITGNVTGGREFRGQVDYSSPYDFRAPAGSTEFDTFLRRTSGSVISQPAGTYRPYYNRLSSIGAGNQRFSNPYVLSPADTSQLRINDRALNTPVPSSISSDARLYRYFGRSRRVSNTTSSYFIDQLKWQQRNTPPQLSQYLMLGGELTDEQRQIINQQLRVDPGKISDEAPSLKYKHFNDEKSLQSYLRTNLDYDYFQQFQTQKQETTEELEQPQKTEEELDDQLLILDKQLKQLLQDEGMGTPRTSHQTNQIDKSQTVEPTDNESLSLKEDVIDSAGLSTYRSQSITDINKDIDAYMERRSKEQIATGDTWLSKQKFYRAENAYTTALIYQESSEAYAGKCHALFGAGEYMSSAYFLFLAFDTDPEYMEQEIDIVSVMGGRDVLENRLADVERWVEENDSADLHFLRAYFYYRIGRIDKAQEAIDAAREKKPDSSAINILKRAIDNKR